jgi:hypothetical protein
MKIRLNNHEFRSAYIPSRELWGKRANSEALSGRGAYVTINFRFIMCFAFPPLAGATGWTCFNVVVFFIQVTSWKSFIHLRHCVTPPPAEDMK